MYQSNLNTQTTISNFLVSLCNLNCIPYYHNRQIEEWQKAFFTSGDLPFEKILVMCIYDQKTVFKQQGSKHAELSGQSRHLLLLEMWLWEKIGLWKWVLRGRGWMGWGGAAQNRNTSSRGLSSHFNLCPAGWRNQCTLILQSSACLRLEKHCLSEITLPFFLIMTRYSKHTHAQTHGSTHVRSHWNALIIIQEVKCYQHLTDTPDITLASKGQFPEPFLLGEILFACSECKTTLWHFHGTSLHKYDAVVATWGVFFQCYMNYSSFLSTIYSDSVTCETY